MEQGISVEMLALGFRMRQEAGPGDTSVRRKVVKAGAQCSEGVGTKLES